MIDTEDVTEWTFFVKPLVTGAHLLLLHVPIVEKIDNENVSKDIVLEEQVTIVTDAVAEQAAGFKTADYTLNNIASNAGADNVAVVIPPGVGHALRSIGNEDLIMAYGTSGGMAVGYALHVLRKRSG